MSESPPSVVRGNAPKETEAIGVAVHLARQLVAWHRSGRWHGLVGVPTVMLDAPTGPVLTEPEPLFRLGESAGDWERLPPVLHEHLPLELSSDLALARRRLLAAGISIDPIQIDLYSLAALLCRWISGESASAFLRSPKAKRLIPEGLQPVLERTFSSQEERRYVDAAELARALESANSAIAGPDVEPPVESLNSVPSLDPTGDTTPSRISLLTGNDTSVILQTSDGKLATSHPSNSIGPSGPAEALPFTTLGHYEIRRRIGHGGMGDVYLGYERALDRQVAIKVLPAELARDEEFVRRFHAEAAAVARLIHPNIVPIFYIGEDQGHHFYAMQFIEGESLADLLARRGKLPIEEALPIVEQTLAGLGLAHDHGMVHRDIKPGNILLDQKSRRALLADFGLVKSLSASVTGKTATGVIMGTVDYISPEQGRGQSVDSRSDLYSIGVLLFRMLSGELPFTADSPTALIFQHVYEKPPLLSSKVAGIPAHLEVVIERLLAKAAGDRYPDVRSLLSDLQAIRAGRPIAKVESTRNIQLSSERPSPTRIIVAPVLEEETDSLPEADSITPPGWRDRARSIFWRHAPEAVQKLQGTQQLIDRAISKKRREEELLRRLAGEAESILGQLSAQEREQRAVADGLRHQPADGNAPTLIHAFQADEIAALEEANALRSHAVEQQDQLGQIRLNLARCVARRQQLENQRDILNARLRVAEVRESPSEGRGASSGSRLRIVGGIVLAVVLPIAIYFNRSATEEYRREIERPSAAWATRIESPSARSYPAGGDVVASAPLDLLAVPTVQIEKEGRGTPRGNIQGVRFDRMGTQLAVLASSQNAVFNASTWATVMSTNTTVAGARERATLQVPTPDLTAFVVGTSGTAPEGGRLELRDLGTGRLTARSETLGTSAKSVVLHPAGTLVAAVHTSPKGIGRGYVWKLPSLSAPRPVLDESTDATVLAFHPDGKHLACGTASGSVHLIRLDDGRSLRTITGSAARITCLDFGRDGRTLATGDDQGGVCLWDAQNWQVAGRFIAHRSSIFALRLSPDCQTLATSDDTGTLLWDVTLGVVRSVLRTRGPVLLEFHPSKPWLLTAEQQSPAISIWNASAYPAPRFDFDSTTGIPLDGAGPIITRLQTLDRSRVLAGAGHSVWLVDSDIRTATEKFRGHTATIRDICLSGDRRTLATGGDDGEVRLWDAASGTSIATYCLPPEATGSRHSVHAVALAPDGKHFLSGGVAGLFGAPDSAGDTLQRLPCELEQISSIDWGRQSGKAIAAGHSSRTGRPAVVLWDTAATAPLSTFELPTSDAVRRVALAMNDSAAVVSAGQFVRLFNLNDWSIRQEWKLPGDRSRDIAVSPSGRLVILSDSNHVGIWDIERGNEVVQLSNSNRSLTAESFAFTPDDRLAILHDRSTLSWRRVTPYGQYHDGYSPNLHMFLPALQDIWTQASTSDPGRTSDWQILRLAGNSHLHLSVPKEISENRQFDTDGGWWINNGVLVQAPGTSRSAMDFGELYNFRADLAYDPGTSNQFFLLLGYSAGRGYCLSKPAASDGGDWLLTSIPEGNARKISVPLVPHQVGPERNLSFNVFNGGIAFVEPLSKKPVATVPMPGFQKGRLILGALRGPVGAAPLRIGELKIN